MSHLQTRKMIAALIVLHLLIFGMTTAEDTTESSLDKPEELDEIVSESQIQKIQTKNETIENDSKKDNEDAEGGEEKDSIEAIEKLPLPEGYFWSSVSMPPYSSSESPNHKNSFHLDVVDVHRRLVPNYMKEDYYYRNRKGEYIYVIPEEHITDKLVNHKYNKNPRYSHRGRDEDDLHGVRREDFKGTSNNPMYRDMTERSHRSQYEPISFLDRLIDTGSGFLRLLNPLTYLQSEDALPPSSYNKYQRNRFQRPLFRNEVVKKGKPPIVYSGQGKIVVTDFDPYPENYDYVEETELYDHGRVNDNYERNRYKQYNYNFNEQKKNNDFNDPKDIYDFNNPRDKYNFHEQEDSFDFNVPRNKYDFSNPKDNYDLNKPKTNYELNKPKDSYDLITYQYYDEYDNYDTLDHNLNYKKDEPYTIHESNVENAKEFESNKKDSPGKYNPRPPLSYNPRNRQKKKKNSPTVNTHDSDIFKFHTPDVWQKGGNIENIEKIEDPRTLEYLKENKLRDDIYIGKDGNLYLEGSGMKRSDLVGLDMYGMERPEGTEETQQRQITNNQHKNKNSDSKRKRPNRKRDWPLYSTINRNRAAKLETSLEASSVTPRKRQRVKRRRMANKPTMNDEFVPSKKIESFYPGNKFYNMNFEKLVSL